MSGRIPLPNYTQVPNVVLDSISELSGGETKVMLAVCRQTFGFHERSATLAISRLMDLTGLAKASVVDATKALVDRHWLKKSRAGNSHEYEVNLEVVGAPAPDVQKVNSSKNEQGETVQKSDSKCSKSEQKPVQKADTSNKEETIKENSTPASGVVTEVSQHQMFIDLWCKGYVLRFDREYAFQRGKDGNAVKMLLAASKMQASELAGIAKQAWDRMHLFGCKRAMTIAGFLSAFNEIREEIASGNPAGKLPVVNVNGRREYVLGARPPQSGGWDSTKFRAQMGLATAPAEQVNGHVKA